AVEAGGGDHGSLDAGPRRSGGDQGNRRQEHSIARARAHDAHRRGIPRTVARGRRGGLPREERGRPRADRRCAFGGARRDLRATGRRPHPGARAHQEGRGRAEPPTIRAAHAARARRAPAHRAGLLGPRNRFPVRHQPEDGGHLQAAHRGEARPRASVGLRAVRVQARTAGQELGASQAETGRLDAAMAGAGMLLAAMWRGLLTPRGVPIVGAVLFLCAAGAVAYALVRTHIVGLRVRALQDVEHDLRVSEAKFAGILDIAADAIISVDDAQRIIHFNTGAEVIFGYTRGEMIGQPLERLIPERFRAAHAGHMRRFASGTETARRMGERREIFGLRRGNIEFPAEASISRLSTPTGMLFTVVLRDITERKRVEHEQRFLATLGEELARSLDYDATAQLAANVAVPALADACLLDLLDGDQMTRRIVSDSGS